MQDLHVNKPPEVLALQACKAWGGLLALKYLESDWCKLDNGCRAGNKVTSRNMDSVPEV